MTRSTKPNRADLEKLWLRLLNSHEQSVAIETLKQLWPMVIVVLTHVDDLQGEVNRLKGKRHEQT